MQWKRTIGQRPFNSVQSIRQPRSNFHKSKYFNASTIPQFLIFSISASPKSQFPHICVAKVSISSFLPCRSLNFLISASAKTQFPSFCVTEVSISSFLRHRSLNFLISASPDSQFPHSCVAEFPNSPISKSLNLSISQFHHPLTTNLPPRSIISQLCQHFNIFQ